MNKRVLFLDIDGVLNSHEYWDRLTADTKNKMRIIPGGEGQIDPVAVSRLEVILKDTGCDVVISSTWRRLLEVETIVDLFIKKGLSPFYRNRFIGATDTINVPMDDPNRTTKERGLQIQRWLDANLEYTKVAILDDDSDMAHLMPYLIKTNILTGLLDEHVVQIIMLFKKEESK